MRSDTGGDRHPAHDLFRHDADVGYTFRPNLKLRVPHEAGAYLIRTNSLGFRSDEIGNITGRNIFVFGDSFTAGDGVSNGRRWSDKLVDRDYDVINFGLPGSGTDQQYLAWKKFAAHRDCALIIVAILVENIRRNMSAYRPVTIGTGDVYFRAKPYFSRDGDCLTLHQVPVPPDLVSATELEGSVDTGGRFPTLRKLVSRLGLQAAVQQMTAYQPVPDFDRADSEGWLLLRAILGRWSDECRSRLVFVPLPLYQHVEGTADASGYQARFAELARDTGRPVIDPLPDLRKYDTGARRRFRFARDVHLSEAGHEAIARSLAPHISALLAA